MKYEAVKGGASKAGAWIVDHPAWAAVFFLLVVSAVAGWSTAIVRARQVSEIQARSKAAEEAFKAKLADSDRKWTERYDEVLALSLVSEKKLKDLRAKIAAAAAARPTFVPPASLEDTRERFGKVGYKGEIRK